MNRTSVLICLLSFSLAARATIPEPVFNGVTLSTQVTSTGLGAYQYNYTYHNPADNTVMVRDLVLDIEGAAEFGNLVILNDNQTPNKDWFNRLSSDGTDALWSFHNRNFLVTAPGTTVTGLKLASSNPPHIRDAQINPRLDNYLNETFHEIRRQRGISLDQEMEGPDLMQLQENIKDRFARSFRVLGPLSVPPASYAHWDLVSRDIRTARKLGWLGDTGLYDTIRIHFDAARTLTRAQDGFAAIHELQIVIDAIQASTPAQRTVEGYALVYYNALFLQLGITYACEPVLTVVPLTATHPIGASHTVTATFINRVDGLPIAGSETHLNITEGPNTGLFQSGVTDVNGVVAFTYSSALVGTDTLLIGPPPGELQRKNEKSATKSGKKPKSEIKSDKGSIPTFGESPTPACGRIDGPRHASHVTWEGGPDLVISRLFPPLVESSPGSASFMEESTKNKGTVASLESVTRYLISTDPALPIDNRIVIGQRNVPTLASGQESVAPRFNYIIPATLPAGHYYLGACADDDQQIIELDESNNCSMDDLTLTMGIRPVKRIIRANLPPAAIDQSMVVNQGASILIILTAHDNDNDPLTFSVVAPPLHGTLSGSPPNLIYAPAAGYFGPDAFTFKANDGKVDSNVATVTIRVNAVPVADNQSVLVQQNVAKAITLTATDADHDPLIYAVVASPLHGALSGIAPNITYMPAAGYYGLDSFTFKVNDGFADSNVATVSIRVNAPPDCNKTVASSPQLWPPNHKFVAISVGGITDPDGDPVRMVIASVRQDEPVLSPGSGNFSPDATLSPLQVRSEREGGGNDRVYHVGVTADDGNGGGCTGIAAVCVPHDQGQGEFCVDEGPLYDSTVR